jgi:hypothetical protein
VGDGKAAKGRRRDGGDNGHATLSGDATATYVKEHATKGAKKEKLERHGFVRLVVFARKDSVLGALLCQPSACVTGVVPAGLKPSLSCAPPLKLFEANRSLDKGAVCAYFPAAKLLFVAAHLHGTKKAGAAEAGFEGIRLRQITEIGRAAARLVHRTEDMGTSEVNIGDGGRGLGAALVLMGNWNFRAEADVVSAADKATGGKDQAWVEAMAGQGDASALAKLSHEHDHMHALLASGVASGVEADRADARFLALAAAVVDGNEAEAASTAALVAGRLFEMKAKAAPGNRVSRKQTAEATAAVGVHRLPPQKAFVASVACPPLLCGAFDAVGATVLAASLGATEPFRPTFAFEVCLSAGRPFSEKCISSWTGRIFARDLNLFFAAAGAVDASAATSQSVVGQKNSDEAALVRCRPVLLVVCSGHYPVTALFAPPARLNSSLSLTPPPLRNGLEKASPPPPLSAETQLPLVPPPEPEKLPLSAVMLPPSTPPPPEPEERPIFEGSLLKQRFELSRLYKTPWKLRFLRLYSDRLEYGKWNRKNVRSKHYGTLVLRKRSPLQLNGTFEVILTNGKSAATPRTITLKVKPSRREFRGRDNRGETSSSSGATPWITCVFQDDPADKKQKGAKFLTALLAVQAKLKAADVESFEEVAAEEPGTQEATSAMGGPGSVLGTSI